MPVNKKIGLTAILAAADDYFDVSGRRLTFEYVLLADINDGAEHARELAQLLAGREAMLNVIPYNPVAGLPYRTPSAETPAGSFAASWKPAGFACTSAIARATASTRPAGSCAGRNWCSWDSEPRECS